jgi:hypothetical protein
VFGQAAQVAVKDRSSAHFWTPNDAPAVRVLVGAVVPGNPPRTGVKDRDSCLRQCHPWIAGDRERPKICERYDLHVVIRCGYSIWSR